MTSRIVAIRAAPTIVLPSISVQVDASFTPLFNILVKNRLQRTNALLHHLGHGAILIDTRGSLACVRVPQRRARHGRKALPVPPVLSVALPSRTPAQGPGVYTAQHQCNFTADFSTGERNEFGYFLVPVLLKACITCQENVEIRFTIGPSLPVSARYRNFRGSSHPYFLKGRNSK